MGINFEIHEDIAVENCERIATASLEHIGSYGFEDLATVNIDSTSMKSIAGTTNPWGCRFLPRIKALMASLRHTVMDEIDVFS